MPFMVIEAVPNAAGGQTVEAWSWPPELQRPTRIHIDVDARSLTFGDTFHFESNAEILWRPDGGREPEVRVRTLGNPVVLEPIPDSDGGPGDA